MLPDLEVHPVQKFNTQALDFKWLIEVIRIVSISL